MTAKEQQQKGVMLRKQWEDMLLAEHERIADALTAVRQSYPSKEDA